MGADGLFLVNGLAVGAIYALSGLGLVVLYRATGVLNLAYGAIGAAGAMLAWQLMHAGSPEALGWLAAIATATALSLLYGRLVAPRLAWREPVVKAVATLGFAMMILAAMNWIWVEAPRELTLASDGVGLTPPRPARHPARGSPPSSPPSPSPLRRRRSSSAAPAPASTCARSPTTARWRRSSACRSPAPRPSPGR